MAESCGATQPGADRFSYPSLCAPAATPRPVIDKVSADMNAALRALETQERILGLGAQPLVICPDEFSRFVRAEIGKWAKVVKDSGATAQ